MNIVIPGAGTSGFCFMGALYKLLKITGKKVKRFKTTSSGATVALLYMLKFTEEEIIELIEKEPWEK